MTPERSSLGQCPACRSTVPRSSVLIEYETDGREAVFAECPRCGAVVDPTKTPSEAP